MRTTQNRKSTAIAKTIVYPSASPIEEARNASIAFLMIVLSLFCVAQASAQTVSLGLKIGSTHQNIQTTSFIDAATPDFSSLPGFQMGAVVEADFGPYFALQSGLDFTQKGFKWSENAGINIANVPVPVGVSAEFRTNYLEIPVLAKVKFGNDKAQVYAGLGASAGYAMSAKIITRPRLLFELDPIRTSVNLGSLGYERMELSGLAALGGQVQVGSGKLFGEIRYQHGFTELYDFPLVNEKIKNRGIRLGAGYVYTF